MNSFVLHSLYDEMRRLKNNIFCLYLWVYSKIKESFSWVLSLVFVQFSGAMHTK